MKGVWKKALVLVLAAVLLVTVYPGLYRESGAQTDLSMDEFEEIIGTYNIDESILSYKDYVKQYDTAKKAARRQPRKYIRIMRVWRETAC